MGNSPLQKKKISTKKSVTRKRGEIGIGGVTLRIDRANEEGVLIAPFINPLKSEKLIRKVRPSVFQVEEHAAIWNIFQKQLNRGILYDHANALRVSSTLPNSGDIKKILNGLRETARKISWKDARLEQRIQTLAEDAIRKRVLDGPLRDTIKNIVDPTISLENIQTSLRRAQAALKGGSSAVISATAAKAEYISDLQERIDSEFVLYGTGQDGFDECLGIGFAPGDTSVITGETGEGKSAVALNLARFFAKQGRRVAYMCWEERFQRCLDKIISAETEIDFTRIVRGNLTSSELETIHQTTDYFVSSHEGNPAKIVFVENPFLEMWLNQKTRLSQRDVIETISNIIADASVDVVIYDMWERSIQESGLHAIEKSLEATQALHVKYQVHGIIVAQMNIDKIRNQRARKDASSIKGSKRAPEVADLVMILDRPSLRNEIKLREDGSDRLFMKLDKQRVLPENATGPIKVEWEWIGKFQKIRSPRKIEFRPEGSIDGLIPLEFGADGIPINEDGSEEF